MAIRDGEPVKPLLPDEVDVSQLFIDDMSIANAILPTGIDAAWAKKARVGEGNVMRAGFDHTIMWGQIYAGRPGCPAQNVRVHFWPRDGRVAVDTSDIAGMASCFFARLVVDDPAKPDDCGQARLIGSCGGDYWRSKEAPWKSDWSNNGDWAIGRFKLLTKAWQPFTGCSTGHRICQKTKV